MFDPPTKSNDFYLVTSDISESFWTPLPTLKSDVINERSLWHCTGSLPRPKGLEFSNYLNDRAQRERSWCQLSIGSPENATVIKAVYGQADLFLEKLKSFYE